MDTNNVGRSNDPKDINDVLAEVMAEIICKASKNNEQGSCDK